VWLGNSPDRFFSLTEADLRIDNNTEGRFREFGVEGLREITGGERRVSFDFEAYASDEGASRDLYQAARQRSPIQVMLQLGQQQGQRDCPERR
jgi:hypothetical protein